MRLYEKYRPKALDDIRGNKEVIKTIKNYIKDNTLPHAIFFQGETGSGKTTIARILANMILGEGGLEWGLREENMSDRTGIADVREMIDASRTVSMGGGSRVFILDEIHNVSKQGQDGLLKAFEDIPNHLYWIICTDNPDKLDKALVGRCQEFKLKKLDKNDTVDMLQEIAQKEGKAITKQVSLVIAENSGNNRKAIQNLEAALQLDCNSSDFMQDLITLIKEDIDTNAEWFKSLMMPIIWPFMIKDADPYDPDYFLPKLEACMNADGAIALTLMITGYCRNRILSQKYKIKSGGEQKDQRSATEEYQRLVIVLQYLSKTNYSLCMKPENNVLCDFLHLFSALKKHKSDIGR
jgi:DNA polymerase III delta prime subunit